MKRRLALLGLGLAAACSEAPAPEEAPKAAAAALQAGQWEVTSEVTRLTKRDAGTPRINTPAGTRETESVCLEEGQTERPNPALFTGSKDSCQYDNLYLSGGTINAGLTCSRPGLSGPVLMQVAGDFTADSFAVERDLGTQLAGDGDVSIVSKVTGRRVASCAAG